MTTTEHNVSVVSENVPTLADGRKWRPAKWVDKATEALRHTYIVGHDEQEKGGVGQTTSCRAWMKAIEQGQRQMGLEEVHCQEDATRWANAVILDKQGQQKRRGSVRKKTSDIRMCWPR